MLFNISHQKADHNNGHDKRRGHADNQNHQLIARKGKSELKDL